MTLCHAEKTAALETIAAATQLFNLGEDKVFNDLFIAAPRFPENVRP